ncbi:MAG: MarR family transcriptional regulator [Candidatus Andeanibacterium colombiense]|uniref:MarR family transcriptional regulator n=1 Tax=Candidatus Andeanibacterium colombiense TaxID=3121345 RepID=A0AAJ6BQH8_9SPHN|nr:MAG: MarR family transcriptional regulator [Sphingomonadaceae bacterium]
MRDPLSSSPGYSLRRASSAMTGLLAERLAAHELRTVEATVMLLIGENPQVTASKIGATLDIQRANMVPLLKRLEDAGLIERTPIDGKSQGLALTAAGTTKMAAVRKTVDRFEAELIARVPEEHRAHLIPALDALWR